MRREILVWRNSCLALEALAEAHGVPVLDVASGLMEYGLKQYLAHYAPTVGDKLEAARVLLSSTGGRGQPGAAPGEEPVLAFIKSREQARE